MTEQTTPPCRWVAEDQPRAIKRRHVEPLPEHHNPSCEGCLPCSERHCKVCSRRHAEHACGGCLTDTRRDLADIVSLYGQLREHAIHGGDNGRLLAAAPIPGADAMVALGPMADAAWNGDDEAEAKMPEHPLHVLATWVDVWREWWNSPTDLRARVDREADYLRDHLHEMAEAGPKVDSDGTWFPPDFIEMVRDIRSARVRLEEILHAGEREERGAPCPKCGKGALVKDYGKHEGDDRWRCPRCREWWTDRDYRNKVDAVYLNVADVLTASDIQQHYRVRAGTVRQWAARGLVSKRGVRNGRQLYAVADVLSVRDGERRGT